VKQSGQKEKSAERDAHGMRARHRVGKKRASHDREEPVGEDGENGEEDFGEAGQSGALVVVGRGFDLETEEGNGIERAGGVEEQRPDQHVEKQRLGRLVAGK